MGPRSSAALAGAVLAGLLLSGCGGGTSDDGAADDPAGSATPTTAAAPARFLELTAQHLCDVQGEVYPDPAALAEAFETPPDYPGIPADRVRSLTRRLETDAGFARDLNERISATCGEDGSAG